MEVCETITVESRTNSATTLSHMNLSENVGHVTINYIWLNVYCRVLFRRMIRVWEG